MSLCRSRFDALVTVHSRNLANDGAGGQVKTWPQKATIWCSIDEGTASENLDRDSLETQRGTVFFTSYRTDLAVSDRLSLDGNNFNVTSLKRVDKNRRPSYRGEFIRIDTDSSVWFST